CSAVVLLSLFLTGCVLHVDSLSWLSFHSQPRLPVPSSFRQQPTSASARVDPSQLRVRSQRLFASRVQTRRFFSCLACILAALTSRARLFRSKLGTPPRLPRGAALPARFLTTTSRCPSAFSRSLPCKA